mmetsp:Transcript_29965/g.77340  ORF Transcript_29965/g.77340 Transcript_29965/m.77340 type:complete len:327 (-) Transcript_29965:216-1196(-)
MGQEDNVRAAAEALLKKANPSIVLMGLRRSGKTSILRVVFQKMAPHETLFLDATESVAPQNVTSSKFVNFEVVDLPGSLEAQDVPADTLAKAGSLIYVIDVQDEHQEATAGLIQVAKRAAEINPDLKIEVFLHKCDGLSEDHKFDLQNEISPHVSAELESTSLKISFYQTSIYDHSIFESVSKVVQQLIPQYHTLENLLDSLMANCRIEKAFLFDLLSKIYVATDSTPVDVQAYELCSDMIDVMMDVSGIYGAKADDAQYIDRNSSSVIKLDNNMILYLKEVNSLLVLVCLMKEENYERHGLIDYNVNCFRDSLKEVLAARAKGAK